MKTSEVPDRLHALDAVRAIALLTGIILHGALAYCPGAKDDWFYIDSAQNDLIGALVFVIHMFRLTIFFFLSGFFASRLLRKIGPRGFMINRLCRIGGPFLIALPLTWIAVNLLLVFLQPAQGLYHHESVAGLRNYAHQALGLRRSVHGPLEKPVFSSFHLWFLWMLILFYGFQLIMDHFFRCALSLQSRVQAVGNAIAVVLGSRSAALTIGAVPGVLLAMSGQNMLSGFPPASDTHTRIFLGTICYGIPFAVGCFVRTRSQLFGCWQHQWTSHLVIAFLSTFLAFTFLVASPSGEVYGGERLIIAVLYGAAMWSWTLALIGGTTRYITKSRPLLRYLADASYWIYLIHLPFVLALQLLIAPVTVLPLVKFALVVGIAAPILLLSYGAFGQYLPLVSGRPTRGCLGMIGCEVHR